MAFRQVAATTAAVSAVAVVAVADPAPVDAHESGYGNVHFTHAIHTVGNQPGCGGEAQGGSVRGVQSYLWASGAYGQPTGANKNQVDGFFGPGTQQAVSTFQQKNNIQATGCFALQSRQAVSARLTLVGAQPGCNSCLR